VAALLVTSARLATADPASDAHALGERFAAAVGKGDVEAILACYAEDVRAIYPGRGQEARGKAALRAMLEHDLAEMRANPLVQKATDAFAVDPTHIMNVGRWETTVAAPDGHRETVTIRTTELLVNEGGTWRYLVDHASIGAPPAPVPHRGRAHHRR
jgi:uncharacterized protein (TIGR02246 family)